jgi:mono/diheme cytochrome c family protein
LNAERGRQKYDQYCSGCHGLDGQGYREKRTPLPYDYVPPVWGPRSYDDAAGFARPYTLAGFVRHAMPWDQPGSITDLDAQEIAAFVDGQPRPDFPDKSAWDGALPFDAVYDIKQYPKNPFFVPLDQESAAMAWRREESGRVGGAYSRLPTPDSRLTPSNIPSATQSRSQRKSCSPVPWRPFAAAATALPKGRPFASAFRNS